MAQSGFRVFSLLALMLVFVTGCARSASPPAPQALAQLTDCFPDGIAVDDTNVYLTCLGVGGPVLAIPVGGGAATTVGVQAVGRALAVDERRLYWSDGSSLLACDKSACASTVDVLASSQLGIGEIVVDDTNVYWDTLNLTVRSGSIMKVKKNGGTRIDGGATPADGSAPSDGGAALADDAPVELVMAHWPSDVAVDATYVYWLEQIGPPSTPEPSPGPWRVPIAGGPAEQIASSDPVEPVGIALDDDNLYFMDAQGSLFTVPKSGGTKHLMLSSLGQSPTGLATDGTNLYMATGLTLLRLPLAGGFPTALANYVDNPPNYLALDATSVYVTQGITVLKVAK